MPTLDKMILSILTAMNEYLYGAGVLNWSKETILCLVQGKFKKLQFYLDHRNFGAEYFMQYCDIHSFAISH